MKRAALIIFLGTLASVGQTGCTFPRGDRSAERFGKTIYLDGAGNWGFGAADIPKGLKEAGYKGDVEIYIWTTSLFPLADQLNIPGAKLRARALAERIKKYRRAYPHNRLNLIALSAGTGVATWAVERLDEHSKINNLVLLGSSLSHNYDMRKALRNIDGRIYAYHSPHDTVLDAVFFIGTIDGKRGVKSIGQVGLEAPPELKHRIVNIPWSRKYVRYGWTGSHTDCTSQAFVRAVLSKHVVSKSTRTAASTFTTPVNRISPPQRPLNACVLRPVTD